MIVPPRPLWRQSSKTVCFAFSSSSAQQMPDLSVARAVPAALLVLGDRVLVRLGRDEAAADPPREFGCLRLRRGDSDRDPLLGQREELGMVDRVVLAAVCLLAALPEQADHLDRLLEQLDPLVRRGPAVAEDVLVQVLAGPEPEREAAGQHRARGGGGMGDDGRMGSDQRARHAGRN